MPELPEVEIGARLLRDALLHRRVQAIQEGPQRPLKGQTTIALQAALVGLTCTAVERHGKLLMITFAGEPLAGKAPQSWRLFCHFAMSGRFLLRAEGEPPQRSCRFSFAPDGGGWIDHLSQRGFGWVLLQPSSDPLPPEHTQLGPDALKLCEAPAAFAAHLLERAGGRQVKAVLLDQRCLAGVGNIYAIEGLFTAQIHPRCRVSEISPETLQQLALGIAHAMRETLRRAEKDGLRYGEGLGEGSPFQCYGRAGLPCQRCGGKLELLRIGGRRSDICPRCQRL